MPGTIVKRGKKYHVVLDYGRDPQTGKRRQVWQVGGDTKREADALLTKLAHERNTGIDLPVEKLMLGDLADRYLKHARANLAPKSYRTTEDILLKHVRAYGKGSMWGLPLAKLKPLHFQAYLDHAAAEGRLDGEGGLSPASVQRHRQVIHACLQYAVGFDLIHRNPLNRTVSAPAAEHKEFRALAPAEVRLLFGVADETPYGALVRLAVWSGLRQGELLALRWSDVQRQSGVLSVRRTIQAMPGQPITFREPKTRGSRRSVEVDAEVITMLRAHRAHQAEEKRFVGVAYRDHGLLFQTPLGTPIDPSNLRRAFRAIVKRTDFGHLRFHDLRHTYGSLMLLSGAGLKWVSAQMGHASVAITGDIYAHVIAGSGAEQTARFQRLLANG